MHLEQARLAVCSTTERHPYPASLGAFDTNLVRLNLVNDLLPASHPAVTSLRNLPTHGVTVF